MHDCFAHKSVFVLTAANLEATITDHALDEETRRLDCERLQEVYSSQRHA
jgi:hypothetical protein